MLCVLPRAEKNRKHSFRMRIMQARTVALTGLGSLWDQERFLRLTRIQD